MAKELNFTQNAQGKWESSFIASGDRMGVEVNRVKSGPLLAYASLEGLRKKLIYDLGPNADADLIFDIDVPEETVVTLISFTEVEAAKVTGS